MRQRSFFQMSGGTTPVFQRRLKVSRVAFMGARELDPTKPRQMPIQVKISLTDLKEVASFGENFSQLSGDDQLGFAIADDAVTEGLA